MGDWRRNFLDKVKVIGPDADTSDLTFMSLRCADMPIPAVDSDVWQCTECGFDIWADKRTAKQMMACKRKLCNKCFMEEVSKS